MLAATGIDLRLGAVDVLSGAQLCTRPGQVVGLIGPNGSGKSSLLRCLYGMLRPSRGAVLIGDEPIESLSQRSIARAVAVVTQDASAEGIDITVEHVMQVVRHMHVRAQQGHEPQERGTTLGALELVNMSRFAQRGRHELSGGERPRVMIARRNAQRTPV